MPDSTEIFEAVHRGDLQHVNRLLAQSPALAKATVAGRWPLIHYAVLWRHADIALRIINAGADVNVEDEDGATALQLVTLRGYKDMVELLLNAGADPNIRDFEGYTTLGRLERLKSGVVHMGEAFNPQIEAILIAHGAQL